jgi:hypothetical protein
VSQGERDTDAAMSVAMPLASRIGLNATRSSASAASAVTTAATTSPNAIASGVATALILSVLAAPSEETSTSRSSPTEPAPATTNVAIQPENAPTVM